MTIKDKKHAVLIEIGKCLDKCRKCPYGRKALHPACQLCSVYEEMRCLAAMIDGKKKRSAFETERYSVEFTAKRWTKEEEKFLRENLEIGVTRIAEKLGRSYRSVMSKMWHMKKKGALKNG
ncbi:hypothetical protein [Geobacillus subterraneus]|nr:hypothetical protein [Geobacillus subterraneus]